MRCECSCWSGILQDLVRVNEREFTACPLATVLEDRLVLLPIVVSHFMWRQEEGCACSRSPPHTHNHSHRMVIFQGGHHSHLSQQNGHLSLCDELQPASFTEATWTILQTREVLCVSIPLCSFPLFCTFRRSIYLHAGCGEPSSTVHRFG